MFWGTIVKIRLYLASLEHQTDEQRGEEISPPMGIAGGVTHLSHASGWLQIYSSHESAIRWLRGKMLARHFEFSER